MRIKETPGTFAFCKVRAMHVSLEQSMWAKKYKKYWDYKVMTILEEVSIICNFCKYFLTIKTFIIMQSKKELDGQNEGADLLYWNAKGISPPCWSRSFPCPWVTPIPDYPFHKCCSVILLIWLVPYTHLDNWSVLK